MASYIYKLQWNGITTEEYDVVCGLNFDGNSGESDSFMSRESIFSEKYDGSRREVYGFRYKDVLAPTITFVHRDFRPFTFQENRRIMSWLTALRSPSSLTVYEEENVVKYCMCGNFTEIQQYKSDGDVIGYVTTFESNSPYAYSHLISHQYDLSGRTEITLQNYGDLFYESVYPVVTYRQDPDDIFLHVVDLPDVSDAVCDVIYHVIKDNSYYIRIEGDVFSLISGIFLGNISNQQANSDYYGKYYFCSGDHIVYRCDSELVNGVLTYVWKPIVYNVHGALIIRNNTTGKTTYIRRVNTSEEITINGADRVITSTQENRVIGSDFNWTWFGLQTGDNAIDITGNGILTIEYRYPIKCGDM